MGQYSCDKIIPDKIIDCCNSPVGISEIKVKVYNDGRVYQNGKYIGMGKFTRGGKLFVKLKMPKFI